MRLNRRPSRLRGEGGLGQHAALRAALQRFQIVPVPICHPADIAQLGGLDPGFIGAKQARLGGVRRADGHGIDVRQRFGDPMSLASNVVSKAPVVMARYTPSR